MANKDGEAGRLRWITSDELEKFRLNFSNAETVA